LTASCAASSACAERWLLGGSAALLLAGWLWVGLRTDFLPCTLDCGETYEAAIGARNLSWSTGGLQDFAASPHPDAHPTLYLHNPNLGMYALALLSALGVSDLHVQTRWLVVPFLLGMLALYGAVRVTTRSGLLAACCLLQAAGSYLLVTLWAFDALRVWSWLLTFGLIYCLATGRRRDRVGAGVCLALSLGVDYPFALFLGLLALACSILRVSPLRLPATLGLILVSLGGALVLRQLQVALVMGPSIWWTDVTASLVRRIPLVALVLSPTDAEDWGQTHHLVVWPGGGGRPQPLTWAWIMVRALLAVLGWPAVVVVLVWAGAWRQRARWPAPIRAGVTLLVALGLALAGTFAVFGEYLSTFYGLFLMPLLVHGVVLLLGLTTYALLISWRRTLHWKGLAFPVAVLLVVFGAWRIATEVRTLTILPPSGYPGRTALAEYPGASVVTLWISSAPSVYTGQWAGCLRTMRWLVQGRAGFTFDPAADYCLFFERDRDNPAYRHPDLLLIPRLRTWGLPRMCDPLGGAILGFADGCSDLSQVETALARMPLARSGPDYLLYDLRVIRARAAPTSHLDTGTRDGLSSGHQRTHETGGSRWQTR